MKTTLKRQLTAYFEEGKYIDSDGSENTGCYVFYDWFCSDKSLERRSKTLFSRLKSFLNVVYVDQESTYVFFKNNCPMNGSLYDDFRVCDRETGEVIYNVTPSCGHGSNFGMVEVWGRDNKFQEPLAKAKTWKECMSVFANRANSNRFIGQI